jgi:hypothetical protein
MIEPRGAYQTEPANPAPAPRTPQEARGDEFTAPLGLLTGARLRFANGAHRISIRADTNVRGLYRARFGDPMPAVVVRGGVVTIQHPRFPAAEWLDRDSGSSAEVELNASVAWQVEVLGGASRLLADLRDLRLVSLRLEGGAGRLEVALPEPSGTVAVAVLGGASNVTIQRPTGVAARLRVEGGATHLRLDDRRIGAAGGALDLKSQGYDAATHRYDIAVTGGANNVGVHERPRAEGRGPGPAA